MLPMRDDDEQLNIELLSQWKLEAEFRKYKSVELGDQLTQSSMSLGPKAKNCGPEGP